MSEIQVVICKLFRYYGHVPEPVSDFQPLFSNTAIYLLIRANVAISYRIKPIFYIIFSLETEIKGM